MPAEYSLVPFNVQPGVYKENTAYAEKGYWYDSDKIRFREGTPEKIGGWQSFNTTLLEGVARDMHSFNDNVGNRHLGVGTQCFLYLEQGGQIYDITPFSTVVALVSGLNITEAATTIIVSSPGHGLADNGHVYYTSMAATVATNVFLSGLYNTSTIDADSYEIVYAEPASATLAAAGSVTQSFYINCGTTSNMAGEGWGIGTWGTSTWGTPRLGGSLTLGMRQWSLDNWGQDLIANPSGDRIYIWNHASGVDVHAALITASPTVNNFVFVSDQDRHLISLGTTEEATGVYNPLLVRWCSQEDYNDWNTSATNTAGSMILAGGSLLVGGLRSRNQNLIWTDNALFAMTFIGPPFTFGFQPVGSNCGLVGPHAAVDVNGHAYWMSSDNFFHYDGAVKVMDCKVLRYVFGDLNFNQKEKIYAGLNSEFQEIFWFYPSSDSTENNRYVKFNYEENTWDIGTFDRSAWQPRDTYSNPIGADSTGQLYYHEVGVNADSSAIDSYIQSAPLEIATGDELLHVTRIIPDITVSGTPNFTVKLQQFPNATTVTKGPFLVSAATNKIDIRGRGRQASVRIGCSGVNETFRLGMTRFQVKPDGKR